MPVHNADITAIFEEIANLLEIEGANPFRIRAYRNAARILGDLPQDARQLVERGDDLTRLPGIGTDLAAKINEIVSSGHCSLLERLRRELPPAITELLKIPGLGPKRVKALYHDLDVQTTEQLHRAALDGRIRALARLRRKNRAEHFAVPGSPCQPEPALQAGHGGAICRSAAHLSAGRSRRAAGDRGRQLPAHARDRGRSGYSGDGHAGEPGDAALHRL